MMPRRSPAKTATSAPSASPGPLTMHPITATFIGSSIVSRLLRTSCTSVNRSTWIRPHVGQAMRVH